MLKINYGSRALRFASRPLEQDAPLNILEGAVRSGKTWCLIPKIIRASLYNVGGRKIITGVSKLSIYSNVLVDLFEWVGEGNYRYNRSTGVLSIFGCEWLVIGARDEGSERKIRGLTVGVAICDELSLMPQSFFDMLRTRLSPAGARLYATTNPDSPYHWLKAILDDEDLRASGRLWSEHYTMADNPNLTPEFVAAQHHAYAGFFFKRFILGLWVLAEGAIYKDSWSDELLYDQKDQPIGLKGPGGYEQRFFAIDYGTTNPMVILEIYDDGTLYWVTREYYWDSAAQGRQKTDAEYADDLVKFIGSDRHATVIIDPSAASFKTELVRRGIFHVDAKNDVSDGIRITSMLLNQRKIRFCRETTTRTVQEMQSYAWDPKAAAHGEEKPLKNHDHAPDALRYFVKTEVPYWRFGD